MSKNKNDIKQTNSNPSDTTQQSIENGKKIIEVNKKVSGKDKAAAEKEEKEDAEGWRNEG